MSSLIAILIFLVMFCIMVAVHELGHYWVGRKFGVGVHEFAVGFGRPILWTWKRKRFQLPDGEPATTDFNLRALPLGGFVRFHGQEPQEDGSETKVNGGLYSISPGKRWLILVAGPMASIIFGVLVLVAQFTLIGQLDSSNLVGKLQKGAPAIEAGLKPGDRIIAVDGKTVKDSFEARMAILANATGKSIPITADRNGEKLTFHMVPVMSDKPLPVLDKDGIPTGKEAISPIIGVEFAPELKRQPFIASVKTAVSLPFIMAQQLAYKITQPKVIVEQSRGVIGMVQETHTILEEQALMVITWCGVISMSLGIMNLLPIGMLDGGQMVIAFAEMLRGGKRLSYNIQMRFLTVGTIIVFAFILFINGRDLVRLVAPAETPAPKVESQP